MSDSRIEKLVTLVAGDCQELIAASQDEGYDFVQRLWDEYRSGSNRFNQPGAALLGGWNGRRLIAIGGVQPDPYLQSAAIGRVRHVYVLPAYRRQGVGRALVLALIAHASAHFEYLTLRTPTAHGERFYKALNFTDEPHFENATHWLKLTSTTR